MKKHKKRNVHYATRRLFTFCHNVEMQNMPCSPTVQLLHSCVQQLSPHFLNPCVLLVIAMFGAITNQMETCESITIQDLVNLLPPHLWILNKYKAKCVSIIEVDRSTQA